MSRVSEEAVEKAARAAYERVVERTWDALPDEWKSAWRDDIRAILVAALPVVERELREQVAQEITQCGIDKATDMVLALAAARVREGGRA